MEQKESEQKLTRRDFVAATGSIGLAAVGSGVLYSAESGDASLPAILGGTPIKPKGPVAWPILQGEEEENILKVLKEGTWCRYPKGRVSQFEKEYAALCGAKHCVCTNSGTSSLITTLSALGLGPGDEVITTPYTFIATLNSIMYHNAIPELVDIDLDTFLIDPKKIEASITDNTFALMPVHIGGSPVDLDPILALGKKKNMPVIEDACQAHFGVYKGKRLGTIGTAGCFSFQVTKNLCVGDGGAILTNDSILAGRLFAAHNNCTDYSTGVINRMDFSHGPFKVSNLRMTEFQGAVLLAQIKKISAEADIRNENALYLTSLLEKIPGIYPTKICQGGRSAWHLYMFRIDEKEFGLSRDKFLQALQAEGIVCAGGYAPQDWRPYIQKVFSTRAAKRLFSAKYLKDWFDRNQVPMYFRACREGVWFLQTQMIGPKSDMDKYAEAIRRIKKNASEIAKKG